MNGERPAVLDIAQAYDRVAADYDTQVAGSQWMRAVLWDAYRRLFRPGQCVLDLSCGTGIDALFLAGLGVQVAGIDISPGMIQQLETKSRRLGLSHMVETCVLNIAELGAWHTDHAFDGIISGFAGLSAVPDLARLATDATRLLKPGGYLVVHMLNRFCLWSGLGLIRHGHWQEARQVMERRTMTANIAGIPVQHYVYYPQEAYRHFAGGSKLSLRRAYSLGWLRPPTAPRWLSGAFVDRLGKLERLVAGTKPFLNWGQFFVLEMQKSA